MGFFVVEYISNTQERKKDFGTYRIGAQGQVTLHSLTLVFAANLSKSFEVDKDS